MNFPITLSIPESIMDAMEYEADTWNERGMTEGEAQEIHAFISTGKGGKYTLTTLKHLSLAKEYALERYDGFGSSCGYGEWKDDDYRSMRVVEGFMDGMISRYPAAWDNA